MTPEQIRKVTKYVDRVDVAETFVDSIENVVFDGVTLRLDLAVTRWDEIKPPAPPTGQRVMTCRLAIAAPAVVDLANKIAGLMAQLQKSGAVKFTAPTSPTVQ